MANDKREQAITTLKPLVPEIEQADTSIPDTVEWRVKGVVQEVVVHKDGVVVLGIPHDCPESIENGPMAEYDDWQEKHGHNCDLMGCGMCHVLWRHHFGHAAATAEGIPQADGWVDVADRLPAQSDLSGYLNDSVFTWSAVGGDEGWASVGRFGIERQKFIGDGYVIAWMPIPTYQRQSREGE